MLPECSVEIQPGELLDVFISYSRRDSDFVHQLRLQLEQSGKRCWLDQRQIMPSTEWLQEINRAIEASDHFLFILSPDSLGSEICALELNHAESLGKKLLILPIQQSPLTDVPQSLSRLQWLSASDENNLDSCITELTETMERDPAWLRYHTELLVKALEWQSQQRDRSLLLRGDPLEQAAGKLSVPQNGLEPAITSLQRDYIESGLSFARKKRQVTLITSFLSIALLSGLLGWAAIERSRGELQQAVASARQMAQQAIALGQQGNDFNSAVLLAAESMQRLQNLGSNDPELYGSLRSIMSLLSDPVSEVEIEKPLKRLKYNQDGTAAAVFLDGSIGLRQKDSNDFQSYSVDYEVLDVSINSAGKLLTTSLSDGIAEIKEEPGGRLIASLSHDGEPLAPGQTLTSHEVQTAALNSTGEYAISGGLSTARIWNLATGLEVSRLVLPGIGVEMLAFSGDDHWAIARSMWYAGVLNADGYSRLINSENSDFEGPVAIASSGFFAAVQEPGNIVEPRVLIWDTRIDNTAIVPVNAVDRLRAEFLAFKPQQAELVAISGSEARLFEATSGNELGRLENSRNIDAASFTPNGHLEIAADNTLGSWAIPGGLSAGRIHNIATIELVFHPDGEQLITHNGHWVTVYNAGYNRRRTIDTEAGIRQLQLSSDGNLLLSRHLNFVDVYDLSTGNLVSHLPAAYGQLMTAMAISRDSARIATGEDQGQIKIWGARDAEKILRISSDGVVGALAFLDSSEKLISASNNTAVTRDLLEHQILASMDHNTSINLLHVSESGNIVVTASEDGELCLWHSNSNESQWCENLGGIITSILLNRSEKFLAAIDPNGVARVWSSINGDSVIELSDQKVSALDFAPDGNILATAGIDGLVRIWDLANKSELARMPHPGRVETVKFSVDGHRLASGGTFGANLWLWKPADLISAACERLVEIEALWERLPAESSIGNRTVCNSH